MSNPLITINLVVFNGEKYLRYCLDAARNQTYPNLEINILDNNSTDRTKEIIKKEFPKFNLIELKKNLGTWRGQEEALKYSNGKYIVALSVDVLLAPDAIEKAIKVMERDPKIGALQAKIYQYDMAKLETGNWKLETNQIIDTVGFRIERSRRITNIGHGEEDRGQYDEEKEVFGVEGATPIIRKEAFEDCWIPGGIIDCDMFWYGDDIDLVWRMRLFGWKQVYSPKVIAYHDRSTTKGMSAGWKDYLKRIEERKKIPSFKKRLDWRNKRLARLKNDYWQNVWYDLIPITKREAQELGYIVLFEPSVLLEIPKLILLMPKMFRKRKAVIKKAKIGPVEMRKWFK